MHFLKIRKGTVGFIFLLILLLANSPFSKPEQIRKRTNATFVVCVILAVHIFLTNRKIRLEDVSEQVSPELPTQQEGVTAQPTTEMLPPHRSRYIPVRSRRLADARFFLDYYASPEGDIRPFRKSGYHYDHITPFARGGTHDPENIRVLASKENLQKGAKMPDEWKRN